MTKIKKTQIVYKRKFFVVVWISIMKQIKLPNNLFNKIIL